MRAFSDLPNDIGLGDDPHEAVGFIHNGKQIELSAREEPSGFNEPSMLWKRDTSSTRRGLHRFDEHRLIIDAVSDSVNRVLRIRTTMRHKRSCSDSDQLRTTRCAAAGSSEQYPASPTR